jgi:cytoskeletal protein CcmA (bactofilin family)
VIVVGDPSRHHDAPSEVAAEEDLHEVVPKVAEAIPAQEEPMTAEDETQVSVVSQGTKIEGSVIAAGSLRVEGEVLGKIRAAGEVSLSPQGRVDANIEARSITLAGTVKGDLTATGDVSLPAESRLDGNIRARNAEVGGVVNGDIVVKGLAALGPRAHVQGDIASKALVISEGAVFVGRSVMDDQSQSH